MRNPVRTTFAAHLATLIAIGAWLLAPPGALAQKKRRLEGRSTTIALFKNDTRLLVVNRENDTLGVVVVRNGNADVGRLVAEIGVGDEPRCVALGPGDREAYVANAASGTVSVVALKGVDVHSVVSEIPVGTEPRGCAVTPNRKRLFVSLYTEGAVAVIDTATRRVVSKVPVGGQPWALAISNDGDRNDDDETVFVSQFFAELIPGGPGEAFDDGKQGVVQYFAATGQGSIGRITLSPLANAGFNADRKNFCTQLNPTTQSDLFCPDPSIGDPADAKIAQDPQGAYPNQLHALLLKQGRVLVPSIGAAPEPPLRFNVNVQGLVHAIDVAAKEELDALTVNLNQQVAKETQPDPVEGSLVRAFVNDIVAIDGTPDLSTVLIPSRGGNYVLRATVDAQGKLDIGAPNVVRFKTGNLPNGVVISRDGRRAYANNELGVSATVMNLENDTVITQDLPTGTPPAPGSFEHAVQVGKLVFFTALGVPDNGLANMPIRDIDPVAFRGKASDNAWSSCASCHPDGLADGATWIFGTGPRQTIPMENFFSKRNPADQQISNWSNVQGSITDFNNGNTRDVQGGKGFAGEPPNDIFNHGPTQGLSEAIDLETLWVQFIRPLNRPQPADPTVGRAIFDANCASCHGGAKWTKSQTIYLNNPTFDRSPTVAGAIKFDPFLTNVGLELVSYEIPPLPPLTLLDPVGTFDAANPLEIRNNGNLALGARGFKAVSLQGVGHSAPYLHDGSAATLDDVFAAHQLPGGATIASTLSAQQRADLEVLLNAIDGGTPTFISDTDRFRDALVP
jgi:YVTN family beta-propeller protein